MKILLANPRGFCAGVVMAIKSLEHALEIFGAPLYAFHEIVHNKHVVEQFRRQGVIFVDNVEDVPEGSYLLYSAHGVSPEVRRQTKQRRLQAIDATCPLVTKVHLEAVRFARQGFTIILIGHEGHDEAVGTIGEAPEQMHLVQNIEDVDQLDLPNPDKVAYLTQTTLSVDDASRIIDRLKQRFPTIVGPSKDDICYATQNRQGAVNELLPSADVVLVLGSQNSSNSNRLAEIARAHGKQAYLIDDIAEIDSAWFRGVETVLITAGASAPEDVVEECIAYLRERFDAYVDEQSGLIERVQFPLPPEVRSGDNMTSSAAFSIL